jgi:histidinol dehydrogenase
MAVFGEVDIDMPAGPSEVMVIADESAKADYVAADLISQCEHGTDSAAVLITDSVQLTKRVQKLAVAQAEKLATASTIKKSLENYGRIILVDKIEDSVKIANDYAPEHLEIICKNQTDIAIAKEIVNAGSVFIGEYSSEPAGDYCSGTNHVLPTNGYAKMFSGLSVESFGKWIQFQELSKAGLASIKDEITTLADVEGLPAHANSINIRFKNENGK